MAYKHDSDSVCGWTVRTAAPTEMAPLMPCFGVGACLDKRAPAHQPK